jgi:hypothetical protein
MMLKLWLALCLVALGFAPAQAQNNFTMPPPAGVMVIGAQVVASCGAGTLSPTQGFISINELGQLCTNASGGSGGLSVTDGATFTAGTSLFTPGGCEYNSSPTVLTSGTQGTFACNQYRGLIVDVQTSNNQLYSTLISPPNLLYSATWGANSYSSGNNPWNGDAKGAGWVDIGAVGGAALGLGQTTKSASIPVTIASDQGNTTVGGAINVTPTDCSTTITTGGTAQNIIAANAALHGFTLANIDASAGSGEPLWMSFTTTAAPSATQSYPLAAPTATTFAGLSSYTTPFGFGTNHAVSIIGATTGHKISCTYW